MNTSLTNHARAPGRAPASPRSARALVAASGGRLTYRQLDYWCRTGWIKIECDAAGSGSRREFTDAEWDSVFELLDEIDSIHDRFQHVQSGKFFAEALARRSTT